ncbi:MAG: YbaN family protein [Xanthomonadales bacterium]|nr:YbaN family protein [Xanthomonadales bacterium]
MEPGIDPPPHRLSPSPLARAGWLALALLSLGLGIIGIVVPGLPTTPFVLLAAFAAARGSLRLHGWLRAHRVFGPMVADWEREGAVSRRAKRMATLMMSLCGVILFLITPRWWMAAIGCGCMTAVATWLWARPEPAVRAQGSGPRAQ